MDAKALYELGQGLFEKKDSLNNLHQEIAEQFYPQRADFSFQRDVGEEFAANLMTSYPLLVQRDLSDQIGQMLRPVNQPWFKIEPADPDRNDHDAKLWLEAAANIQRKAMYDPAAKLARAAKEADNDFATFGQAVMSSEIVWTNYKQGPHLLHRCWHLRDMAWQEDCYGNVGNRFRMWKPTARDLFKLFGDKCHLSVRQMATAPGAKQLREVECMHMVVEADLYDIDEQLVRDKPYVSIFYDASNRYVMEAVPIYNGYYIIPRWQTVSGSQYSYSPATVVGLPDARLLQSMTRTLLEAGEKIANPPMVATDEVVRSDVAIYAGGITWVDRDYDERLGDALRPLTQDARGIPIGIDMMRDSRLMLHQAFYLNKLVFPERAGDMTAYEVSQRVQEYIRNALPLFEPMEAEYNGQLCEQDFDLLRRAGAYGSPYMMPPSLQGARTTFTFMSPLHDAIESQKTQKFLEMGQLLATAVQMDKNTAAVPDAVTAFRDALQGAGIPTKWTRSELIVKQMADQANAQAQAQEMLQGLLPASQAALNLGKASQAAGEMAVQ